MVSFDGIVSIAMSFEAGIPQGIRFVVHIFTVFMTLLQQIFTAVCQPFRTILPTFATDAISGLWKPLTSVRKLCRMQPLHEGRAIESLANS